MTSIENSKELAYWDILNEEYPKSTDDIIQLALKAENITQIFENGVKNSPTFRSLPSEKQSFIKSWMGKDIGNYERGIANLKEKNIEVFPYIDDRYPGRLRFIPNPPLVLYHKGALLDFQNCIAAVGHRNLTSYGHKIGREIGRELASNGYTVVSGLARGTDSEIHIGALEAKGKTVAILATNFSYIYPRENTNLLNEILVNGAAITMTSSRTKLEPYRFVIRNRITSGISKCLIIVETDGYGGTERQFEFAKEQNKPIFILEPDGNNKQTMSGFKKFVKMGAKSFKTTGELLELILKIKTPTKNSSLPITSESY